MNRNPLSTSQAPAAIGPYSQAVQAGETLYCSGQIAIAPETGTMTNGDVETETRQVLENLGAILSEAGLDYTDVVRCTVYLADIDEYGQMNEVYSQYFSESPPSREAVEVSNLPRGARVEISCIAVRTS